MGILSDLNSSYRFINEQNKPTNLRGHKLLLKNFQKLSEIILLKKAEYYGLIESNISISEKKELLTQSFPELHIDFQEIDLGKISEKIDSFVENSVQSELRDYLGELYQKVLSSSKKQDKGIVFTPISVVDYILLQLEHPHYENQKSENNLIDLACGSGLFLIRAAQRMYDSEMKKNQTSVEIISKISEKIYGFDIDPIAVYLSKINIISTLFDCFKSDFPLEHKINFNFYKTNSLVTNSTNEDKSIKEAKRKKYDFVVGNPPYIESKKMDKKTKTICKKYFPEEAKGSFDIYACFLSLGAEMMSENGKLGFIIPNKFLISKYARVLRERFLSRNLINQIVDLAHQRVFRPAVYPIILILKKEEQKNNYIQLFPDVQIEDLSSSIMEHKKEIVSNNLFKKMKNKTLYFTRNKVEFLERVFNLSDYTLGDLIRFRWSISFHRKGIREMFVKSKPKGKNPVKFIGGKPFGGNREIERYRLIWGGDWIDYDREKAKKMNNNFPDYKFFKSKKIIICQNALRIRATIDTEGYVCKDIFLIGHLTDKGKSLNLSLEVILALLNSELYSFLYNVIFSGTEILGNYLHYLPMFLHDLPIKIPDEFIKEELENLSKKMLSKDKNSSEIDKEIDNIIYQEYNCSISEISVIQNHINNILFK
jgi:type I restriction-modification system DNA methylase subunit